MTDRIDPELILQNAPSKMCRVLAHLATGRSLNRFEAQRLGDTCLNSTISKLANDHGLLIIRTPEKVPNNWGPPMRCKRYLLPADQMDKALTLLAHMAREVSHE